MSTIHLEQDKAGSFAVIYPNGFLGRERFGVYQSAIEGATFDRVRKKNVAPLDKVPTILKRLREAEFPIHLDETLKAKLESFTAQSWLDLQASKERIEAVDKEMQTRGLRLFPFQRQGVQWLATRHGSLLADEMGLGKTIQALAALPARAPVLVVAPAVAKGVWLREAAKWRPLLRSTVLQGRGSFRWPEEGEIVITNYDILPDIHTEACAKKKHKDANGDECKGCAPFLDECPEGCVVLADEAHNLKNGKAQRTLKFRGLGRTARGKGGRTWLLTATPLLNRPQELWSVYQAAGIAQEAFGTWKGFLKLFEGRPGQWGGYTWGTPQAEVGERIRRVCLRRLRHEVMPQLPRKTWKTISVEIDRRTLKRCDELLEKMGGVERLISLIEGDKLEFEMMSAVRAALATAKTPALLKLIEEYEEQEEPVVVFSAHRAPIDMLSTRPGWATITGDTAPEERTRIEEAFQRGELKGVGATIKAGGVAITLTRSAHAVFCDLEWTPALNSQAEDRICRIGQTRGCVITTLTAEHVLDERITELLTRKAQLIDASVDAARDIPGDAPLEIEEIDLDFENMVKAAEEEVRLASQKPKEAQAKKSNRRGPETDVERWVVAGLRTLAGLDEDHAAENNGVGFNATDTGFGHSLAKQLDETEGLTPKQWVVAEKMLVKYHGQIGRKP